MPNLRETFLDELKDLYDAEKQLTKGLPKMAKAASHPELKEAFENHLEETKTHVDRLEQIFGIMEEEPKGKKCKAMQGLLEEGAELIEEEAGDAALICAAQKVEHYEIASYGSLAAWARLMNMDEAVDLLESTLDEEKTADENLTDIAETAANVDAEEEGEEEDSGEEPESNSRATKPKKAGK